MKRFVVTGALAWDRPVWLSDPLASGARVQGRTLGGALEGRLGGGAANACVALASAGRHAIAFGAVSEDATGDAILASAAAAGVDLSAVTRLPTPSSTTLILLDPGGERVVLGLDHPGGRRFDEETRARMEDAANRLCEAGFDGLFVRSPMPGVTRLMEAAIGPVVSHWPTSPAIMERAVGLVGSADDLGPEAVASPYSRGRELGASSLAFAVLTQGSGPVIVETPQRRFEVIPPRVEVKDATGAGDIFGAGLLEALASGADVEDAVRHACRWGACAVGMESSAPVGCKPGDFPPYGA